MRVFVSAGEPSGDLHGANLVRHLRQLRPDLEVVGFGGQRMADAGCNLLYPLCDLALVGLWPVLVRLPSFVRILGLAREEFRRHRPDAVVLIDYPGFHWWLGGCARKHGIPVSYFVPPQIWAWGTWRAGKMRRIANQVLCSLPFEQPWYAERDVPARYIGHPYFDELRAQRLDRDFLSWQQDRPGPALALLPGSRRSELHHNVPSLLRAAQIVHARRPDVRFLVACLREEHANAVRAQADGLGLPFEVHHGRTPEIIHLAHSCLAVSGSVSLELLFRAKPAAITYRVSWSHAFFGPLLKRCKYITLVNLLADEELYPEYFGTPCTGDRLAGHALHWLQDRAAYEGLCGQLAALRERVAQPGACERAARAVLELAQAAPTRRAA